MTDVLRILHQEHTNLGKLLKILERRFAELAAADANNLELIRDIFEYCQNFPDACHHPKEDLILKKLKVRDPEAAARIGDLTGEHAELREKTNSLAQTVSSMLADGTVSRDAVQESAQAFIETYWRHMALEEEQFFPAARRALTESDWRDIEHEINDPDDPLFSPHVAERFSRLRYEIFDVDGASC